MATIQIDGFDEFIHSISAERLRAMLDELDEDSTLAVIRPNRIEVMNQHGYATGMYIDIKDEVLR